MGSMAYPMRFFLPYSFTYQGEDLILEQLFTQKQSYSGARTCSLLDNMDHSHCLITMIIVSYAVSVWTLFSGCLCCNGTLCKHARFTDHCTNTTYLSHLQESKAI